MKKAISKKVERFEDTDELIERVIKEAPNPGVSYKL